MTLDDACEARAWAEAEFGHAALGDVRRTRRLVALAAQTCRRPAGTLPAVFDEPAALHGAYDFVENAAVDPAAVAAAMHVATARRAVGLPFVWVVTDGSSLTITDRRRTKGTGPLGTHAAGGRGDKVHTALALAPDGTPLGLCGQVWWQRPARATRATRAGRATAAKETQRWLDVLDQVRAAFAAHAPGVARHTLRDREADAWPLVLDAVTAPPDEHATIRAAWDRRLLAPADAPADAPTTYLRGALAAAPVVATRTLAVPAGPRRAARGATLEVRACAVTLDLHDKRTSRRHAAPVWAVCAREVGDLPAGVARLEWLLLTTWPVTDAAAAAHVLDGYALRWRIEEFHAAWKSAATDVEATQLRAADHRARWMLVLAAVACAVLRWSYLARTAPATPAAAEVAPATLAAVRDLQARPWLPARGATLAQFVEAVARIGGYPGPGCGKPPGVKVFTRGWRDVCAYRRGLERRAHRPPDEDGDA
jgi:hypothetical protein